MSIPQLTNHWKNLNDLNILLYLYYYLHKQWRSLLSLHILKMPWSPLLHLSESYNRFYIETPLIVHTSLHINNVRSQPALIAHWKLMSLYILKMPGSALITESYNCFYIETPKVHTSLHIHNVRNQPAPIVHWKKIKKKLYKQMKKSTASK